MATTLIGTLRPHAKGVHVQDNAYDIMDVVTSADGSRAYMAVQDVPADTALDNAAYWCIYTDVSAVKTAMENATNSANNVVAGLENRIDEMIDSAAGAIGSLTDYTSEYALRVRGEIAESAGNPVTIAPDEGSLIRPVTVFGPKQEGSGDPYPAGCGKNLADYIVPVSGSGLTFNAEENGFSVSGTTTTAYNKQMFVGAGLKAGVYTLSVRYDGSVSDGGINVYINADIQRSIWKRGTLSGTYSITFELTADIESFRIHLACEANATYNISVTEIQLEAGSTVTPYAPYSNIRPLSGWDALELNHAGKNLFQLNVNGVYTKEGVTFTPDNASGIVKLSGTASARASLRVGKFTANADYEIILNGAEGGSLSTYELCLCDANGNSVLLRSYGGDSVAYMLTNGTSYTLYLFVYSGAVCDGVVVSPMIRLASNTDATFVPYQIDTYTANPSQTVYNGKVDWTKGEMVDDTDLLDLGDYSWFMQYDGVFRTNSYFEGTYANEMVLCSHYKSYGLNLSDIINNNNSVCMIGGYIWVGDKRFTDAESLRAALVGVKMTARKVTPTTIQLTPHQILALKGANTFYGDGDSIDVKWAKPLETSIKERTEPLIERIAALEKAILNG